MSCQTCCIQIPTSTIQTGRRDKFYLGTSFPAQKRDLDLECCGMVISYYYCLYNSVRFSHKGNGHKLGPIKNKTSTHLFSLVATFEPRPNHSFASSFLMQAEWFQTQKNLKYGVHFLLSLILSLNI